jgi:hypothetical protein
MAESNIDQMINRQRAVYNYDGAIETCDQGIKLLKEGISECYQMGRGLSAFMQYMTDVKVVGREIGAHAASADSLKDDVGRLLRKEYLKCSKSIVETADQAEGSAFDSWRWYRSRCRQLVERQEALEETRKKLEQEKEAYMYLKRQAEDMDRDRGYSR